VARVELERTIVREGASSEGLGSELAIHTVAERVEALKAAERVLYEAVQAKAPRPLSTDLALPTRPTPMKAQ